MEPNIIFMYIRNEEMFIILYRVRKDEHYTHSEVQNNLHPDGTKFNIHARMIQ